MTANHDLARDLIESLRARYTCGGWSAGMVESSILGYLMGVLAEGMDRSEEFKNSVQYYTEINKNKVEV